MNAIQMVDNFIPYFDMQEQIERLPGKNMEGQIEKLLADIAARKKVRATIMEETKAIVRQYHQTLAEERHRLVLYRERQLYSLRYLCQKLSGKQYLGVKRQGKIR